ncbi:hypothetical protein ABZ920_28595 [Streptomyces sp. NPDC046831]|uniref:hypothetical protein n=1 Tax=Streptomyces sp. NPDC046831 TaxID=3154805 RepID=UPI0033F4F8DD
MHGHRARWTTGAALTAAAALGLTGCSDDGGSPSDAVSKASSAAASLASQANEGLASATAEAGRRLDEVKNGVDARSSVRLGSPATASDGRTTVDVGVTNSADSTKSFTVQVNFKKPDGSLLDTVVVSIDDVPAGQTGKAVARSTHTLSGQVKAEVGAALRH